MRYFAETLIYKYYITIKKIRGLGIVKLTQKCHSELVSEVLTFKIDSKKDTKINSA